MSLSADGFGVRFLFRPHISLDFSSLALFLLPGADGGKRLTHAVDHTIFR